MLVSGYLNRCDDPESHQNSSEQHTVLSTCRSASLGVDPDVAHLLNFCFFLIIRRTSKIKPMKRYKNKVGEKDERDNFLIRSSFPIPVESGEFLTSAA